MPRDPGDAVQLLPAGAPVSAAEDAGRLGARQECAGLLFLPVATMLYAALGSAWLTQRPSTGGRRGGIARSRDGGASWEKVETDYTRAVIVPPARPELVLAGPALEVGARGRIVVSADGGDTWEPAGTGVDTPMPDMVERFVAAPDGSVWAVCSGGRLLRAMPGTWAWEPALPSGADLQARSIAFVQEAA